MTARPTPALTAPLVSKAKHFMVVSDAIDAESDKKTHPSDVIEQESSELFRAPEVEEALLHPVRRLSWPQLKTSYRRWALLIRASLVGGFLGSLVGGWVGGFVGQVFYLPWQIENLPHVGRLERRIDICDRG